MLSKMSLIINLPTLKYRRFTVDVIEDFIILNCYYDYNVVPNLILNSNSVTREKF